MFDRSRVPEYAKIRTVLQSTTEKEHIDFISDLTFNDYITRFESVDVVFRKSAEIFYCTYWRFRKERMPLHVKHDVFNNFEYVLEQVFAWQV